MTTQSNINDDLSAIESDLQQNLAISKSAPSKQATRYLKIEQSNLKLDTFDQIKDVLELIESAHCLEYLKFSGNSLGVECADYLAQALIGKKETLKILDLSDIFTSRLKSEIPKSLEFLSSAMLQLTHLTQVDFSDNAFGPHGAQPLTQFLENSISLESLILNNNGLGETGGSMIFEALIKRAKKQNQESSNNYGIKQLSIGRNRLDSDKVIKLVSEAIELNKHTLQILKLPQNGIRPSSMKILINSIMKCTSLETLDLQDNTFGSEAADLFDINKLENMRHLNLGECLIKNKPFMKIINKITKPTKIEELNLTYNELDAKSIKIFIQHLNKFKILRKLDLNGNCFPENSKVVKMLQDELVKHNNYCELGSFSDMEEYSTEEEDDKDTEKLSDVNEADENELTELTEEFNKLTTK